MSWFRIEGTYGPGHQATHIDHEWYETPPTENDVLELRMELENQLYTDNLVLRVTAVDVLPNNVRDAKIRGYQSRIRSAQAMLMLLGVKPTP